MYMHVQIKTKIENQTNTNLSVCKSINKGYVNKLETFYCKCKFTFTLIQKFN